MGKYRRTRGTEGWHQCTTCHRLAHLGLGVVAWRSYRGRPVRPAPRQR
jgi:hypothetical protein